VTVSVPVGTGVGEKDFRDWGLALFPIPSKKLTSFANCCLPRRYIGKKKSLDYFDELLKFANGFDCNLPVVRHKCKTGQTQYPTPEIVPRATNKHQQAAVTGLHYMSALCKRISDT
jgi:hypothetical protein